jgi:hypothetical protein
MLRIFLFALLAMPLATIAPAKDRADDFPGVKGLMTAAEFEAAGLDKLSQEELEALDAWLIRYTVDDAEVVRETSDTVREAEEEFSIEAMVQEPFDGWNGDTVFRLDNGQVWRQRVPGRYYYTGNDRRVVIKRNFLGLHVLKLLDADRSIGVTRVR